MSKKSDKLKHLQPLIGTAAFALAAFLVYRALRQYSLSEIADSMSAISPRHFALGGVFTLGSFICLSCSDTLAVRYTESRLAYHRIALASFTSMSIGHTLGLAALSSGAVRYRFYTGWGLSTGDVGRIVVFCGVTVGLGLLTLIGAASVIRPVLLAQTIGIASPAAIVVVGIAMLLIVGVYLALAAFLHRPIRIRRFELPVPSLGLAIGQVLVGTADFLLVSAVLHQMLLASTEIGYVAIAAIYVAGNVAGIVTHVPGGLGVIEAVVLSLVPGAFVVGALIAFRAVYYLVPFVIGCGVLIAAEIARRRS